MNLVSLLFTVLEQKNEDMRNDKNDNRQKFATHTAGSQSACASRIVQWHNCGSCKNRRERRQNLATTLFIYNETIQIFFTLELQRVLSMILKQKQMHLKRSVFEADEVLECH